MSTQTQQLNSPTQITEAVDNLIAGILTDETKAHNTFRTTSVLTDGLVARNRTRGFEYVSDEPPVLGGNDLGPTPVELVLGALCACQEIVVKAYASVLDIPVSKVTVDARGELDLRGFLNVTEGVRSGFHTVSFDTVIETSETNAGKLEQLKFFTENRCPVLDIIQNPVAIKGSVNFSTATEASKAA